ncbi:hypothetical protein LQZ19_01880 [Treponema primitia]|uniref:hypothetical protein n=1 Tax=Treponema primitia TaxID=88058 RepID=UPI003980ABC1
MSSIDELVSQIDELKSKINELESRVPVIRTVCDAQGRVDKRQTQVSWSPYGFYVQKEDGESASVEPVVKVNMTLPLGGELSGLYSFPRIGDKVLVLQSGGAWYLSGYVPSENDIQNSLLPYSSDKIKAIKKTDEEIEAIKEKSKDVWTEEEKAQVLVWDNERSKLQGEAGGLVLRRQKSGPHSVDTKYSEVSIYDAASDWVAHPSADQLGITLDEGSSLVFKEKSGKYIGYRKKDDEETEFTAEEQTKADEWRKKYCDSDGYPLIDRMNIQSAGDLHSRAENHHLSTGKRVEILADCGPVSHRSADNSLNKGEIYICAKKRIIIEAGKEIQLKVGRTSLVIDDMGFRVTSRRVSGKWGTSWDASLNVNPMQGIIMSGQNVNITGTRQASMGDSYGGGLSSRIGVVQIAGREVALQTYNEAEYLFNMAIADSETVFNNILLGLARGGVNPSSGDGQDIARLVVNSLKKIANLVKSFTAHWKKYSEVKEKINEANEANNANTTPAPIEANEANEANNANTTPAPISDEDEGV